MPDVNNNNGSFTILFIDKHLCVCVCVYCTEPFFMCAPCGVYIQGATVLLFYHALCVHRAVYIFKEPQCYCSTILYVCTVQCIYSRRHSAIVLPCFMCAPCGVYIQGDTVLLFYHALCVHRVVYIFKETQCYCSTMLYVCTVRCIYSRRHSAIVLPCFMCAPCGVYIQGLSGKNAVCLVTKMFPRKGLEGNWRASLSV